MKHYYGFISNGQTAALVSPQASVDWLPFPHFDSDSVFSRILDTHAGGHMAIHPESHHHADQSYVPGTNVLETRLRAPAGLATITDYLVIGRAELRRHVTSEVPLILECMPRFGYGQSLASVQRNSIGAIFRDPRGQEALLLTLRGPKARKAGRERWLLPPGDHDISLRHTPDFEKEREDILALEDDPQRTLDDALQFWRSAPMPRSRGRLQLAFERSILTMRALTVRTNGAVLAAPTTSLPEQIGSSRNWDYRYVWVRDASYAAEAFLLSGDMLAARRLIEFLLSAVQLTGKPFLSPFMRSDGTFSLGERELGWLSGNRGSQPVRVGNAASAQLQLDVEGDLLYAIWRYVQDTDDAALPKGYWWAIRRLAEWTVANWRRSDSSLWEFRSPPERYTHSLVLCWVSLSAAAQLATVAGKDEVAHRWAAEASLIEKEIWANCYRADLGYFTQGVGLGEVDAALLCLPLYGFVASDDPRWLQTQREIEARLVEGALVYRYRRDALGNAAHPFTLGSTWLARCYLRQGDVARAADILEGLVSVATPLLLWGEHVDPQEGEQRGNFPQLFPHSGFVAAATELGRLQDGRPLTPVWRAISDFDLQPRNLLA